jgi:hypothetical protein
MLALRLGMLLLPILLLALAAFRAAKDGRPQTILWLGTLVQVLVSLLVFKSQRLGRSPLGSAMLVLYVIALSLLAVGHGMAGMSDWYPRYAQGVLFLVGTMFFAHLVIAESGVRDRYQACKMALALADRTQWPADLNHCRQMPEVKQFREALQGDPSPAFALLGHAFPEVRVAAFAALEGWREWQPGQPELLAEILQRSPEAGVKAAALRVLASVRDRPMVERLSMYFNDPAREVRQAAAELLRWSLAERWPWLRLAVRDALAHPAQADGPLLPEGTQLPPEAIKDLKAWVAEKGLLSVRATWTLAAHYERCLAEHAEEKLLQELRHQLLDAHTPAVLRIELSQLMQRRQLFDKALLEKLLDPMNPAPLRVIAADALLAAGKHAGASTALRDVARMPNRDIALATADVVQRRLGVDLGLTPGQTLPPINSRPAADVTRRVMAWAREADLADSTPDTKVLVS